MQLILTNSPSKTISGDCVPYKAAERNKNIILVVTRNGGHVGWFHGFWRPKRVSYDCFN